ncbi:tyrosine-type recombinase/integrase [Oerskovia sp. NPDC060338]|uniref:tyrosine-type recombinase/integrase n=1 Tax=Oerskovia sp. NPDC060338 TaxID=3347100 RepID=UPI0036670E50
MTWGAWCETHWWPSRTVEASTLRADANRRDVHVMPRWRDVPLTDITRHDVKAWAAELRTYTDKDGVERTRSGSTVQRIVHLLSASLAAAVDAEVLTSNPASRLKLGGGTASHEHYLTREEFDRALEHLDGEHRVMAQLLAGTGMRWGEATGLHWERVDARRGVVEIAEVWDAKGRRMKPYPKGKRRRHVPLPEWIDLGAAGEEGACGYEHTEGRCPSRLVITTPRGAVLDATQFRTAWNAACAEAGVGHVRVHDLRHSYASWLLQGDISLARVGRLLGHVSSVTTQRYAHLDETPADDILHALGARRAPDLEPEPFESPANAKQGRRAGLRVVR